MNLFFIGDVHGSIQNYLRLLAALPSGSRSIAVGDLYIGRPGILLPELKPVHKFIRGNHDSPQMCREHANFLGEHGFLEEDNLFYLGGGRSANWRVVQNSCYFYKDEELSEAELARAITIYKESCPRIVVSHEAPCDAARKVLEGLHGNYYSAKRDAIEHSRTSLALQQMLDAHQPEVWFFGHFHVRRELIIGRTLFRCLAELEVAALETTRTV